MTDIEIMSALTDLYALAGTMYAEAAGDVVDGSSVDERIAVGCVCRNRKSNFRKFMASEPSYRGVCLAAAQFSCWIPGSGANHARLMARMEALLQGMPVEPILTETVKLAQGIIDGSIADTTDGANFYYAPAAMKPAGSRPGWAVHAESLGNHGTKIGSQIFYKL